MDLFQPSPPNPQFQLHHIPTFRPQSTRNPNRAHLAGGEGGGRHSQVPSGEECFRGHDLLSQWTLK